jgi:hypothetical protein
VLGVQDGASVTTHVNGPLVNAMIDPGIFYGDEFNLLKEDVQKRMNSAFDERRSIDRSDGMQVFAKKGFWGVISYNPTQNFTSRDLEDSVADRFIHLHYERWTPDFKAYVAHKKAIGNKNLSFADFGITLVSRNIVRRPLFSGGWWKITLSCGTIFLTMRKSHMRRNTAIRYTTTGKCLDTERIQ